MAMSDGNKHCHHSSSGARFFRVLKSAQKSIEKLGGNAAVKSATSLSLSTGSIVSLLTFEVSLGKVRQVI